VNPLHPLGDQAALLFLQADLVRALCSVFLQPAYHSDAVLLRDCGFFLFLIRYNLHSPFEESLETSLCFLDLLALEHAAYFSVQLSALFNHDPLDCFGCPKELPFLVFRFG
jgi:hypothetical protein